MSDTPDFSQINRPMDPTLEDTIPSPRLDDTAIETTPVRTAPLLAAMRCEVGAVRERNEDSCLVVSPESGGHFPLRPFGLYIVADGMGGHENGHVASKTASRTAGSYVLEHIYLPLLRSGVTPEPGKIDDVMRTAVLEAHAAVYNPDPARDGGTTLTMALVLGQRLHIAHVGDSRAYWLVDGQLEALTNDHSLVQRLQEVGQLTAEEAHSFQYRNVLLRALGQEDTLEVDIYTRALPRHGRLLLCSDGLCGIIDDAMIRLILQQKLSLDRVTSQLVDAAMEAGGYDNISAVVVEFSYS